MSTLRIQVLQLKKDFKNYDKKFPSLTLDNGNEMKIGLNEMMQALCSIGTDKENRIVKAIKGHKIIRYTGSGNMPELIKSLAESMENRV
jgi:hypothetical protein